MNFIGYFVTLIASLALGYFFYPLVFISNAPKEKNYTEKVTVYGQSGTGKMTLDIDLRDIKPKELPKKVRILSPVTLKDSTSDMKVTLEKGATANVIGYQDLILEIKDQSGKFKGKIAYDETDFTRAVAQNKLDKMTGYDPEAKKLEAQKRAEERARMQEARDNAMVQSSILDEEEEEEKKEEAKEDTGPLTTEISADEITALIQASIKSKTVSEVDFDGVTKWEAGEKETLSEVEYQIGYATYEKESIFGKQPAIAKALIRNGVVKKWVYAKSGLDMP